MKHSRFYVQKFNALHIVTGTTIEQPEQPSLFGERKQVQKQKVEREPLAILVLLSTVVGLGLSFLKGRKSSIVPAITGVTGLILLLLLKAKLDNDILREGQGILQLEYGVGFWLTFLLFLFAAAWNSFLFSQRKKGQEGDTG